MAMLQKMWDDVVAGPHPDKGLGRLRKISTTTTSSSASSPKECSLKMRDYSVAEGGCEEEKSPWGGRRENVWWSTFHPGSNPATRDVGADLFDKAPPTSPTVYDWLYSSHTKTTHR